MKTLVVFLMVIMTGSIGFGSLIIDGMHYSGIAPASGELVYDGINAAYVISQIGKNSVELGGNFSFLSPSSSEKSLQERSFQHDIKSIRRAGLRFDRRIGGD